MKTIDKEARKLCRHTVVYTDIVDIECALMALQGRTTKSIAKDLGVSESVAQYRISKAQKALNTKFRANYRNCSGLMAGRMMEATRPIAMNYVKQTIAPKFLRFAKAGVPRM